MRHSKPIVLVVEDEPLMKMHAVSLVADAGFDTVEASNADELAHAIRRRWPPIELILTSGDFQVAEEYLPRRGRFLPKPYGAAEVISALNELAG